MARRYIQINYDPWQIDFLKVQGDKILCTGRQVGKTEVCAKDAGDYAKAHPDMMPIVMIAPTERQARALFTKTLNYLADTYPKLLIKSGKDRPTNTRIKLKTGVEIFCLPVGKDGLGIRFLTIGRLYKDECSRIPEAVHEAVDPALLTTGGDEILLSTPFGAKGTFYETWINKDGVYESFTRFSITSEKVIQERPICASWTMKQREKGLMKLDQAKSRWSKRRYAQEYLGEFMESLNRWFSDELINDTLILKMNETPGIIISENRKYAMGVDIARMGEDESSFEILDFTNKKAIKQVYHETTAKKYTTETEDKIIQLTKQYLFKRIYIDAGAGTLGVSIMDHLLRIDITKRRVVAINNAKRLIDNDGHTTKLKKEDLYDNLRALMEKGQIKLFDNDEIRASLASVQYEYIMKDGEETRLRIFSSYGDIVEGLIRAAECSKDKSLNIYIY